MTNAHGEPTLANELKAELDSADSVDLLCAFVMWRGVRLFAPALERVKQDGIPFRVLTTTYIGGTEREALDRLVRDYGAEVKVQYDAARTRLHAKAWLFRRDTGFDTAYVGSSNLSTGALLDGVEWNVRLVESAAPRPFLQKFEATFDTYWNSTEFERYDPDLDRDRLDDALLEASGRRDDRPRHALAVRPRGPSVPVPTGDAGRHRGRAQCPRPPSQSRRRCDRHRQDRRCRPRLSPPVHDGRWRPPVPPVCRAPEGDPRAVAADLSGGPERTRASASSTWGAPAQNGGAMCSPACSR